MTDWVCMAGRVAFNMGNPTWREPCNRPTQRQHIVTDPDTPGAAIVELCDYHYADIERQGLITEPTPSMERQAVAEILRPELGRRLHG